MADELPDGLVVADDAGRVVVFNRAAVRSPGSRPRRPSASTSTTCCRSGIDDGRDWWMFADPYNGLATRSRHPERSLFLGEGTAEHGGSNPRDRTEVLVSVGYVRDGRSGPVRRLVISLRGAQERARLERKSRRARLHGRARAARAADVGEGVHRDAARQVVKVQRRPEAGHAGNGQRRRGPGDRLITELLDVSRIESGRMEVRRQLVDVPERARKTIAGGSLRRVEDRFRLEAAHDLPETWLDADKIDQISATS